jgi:hypothetical protein
MTDMQFIGPWQAIALKRGSVHRCVLIQRLCRAHGEERYFGGVCSVDMKLPNNDERLAAEVFRYVGFLQAACPQAMEGWRPEVIARFASDAVLSPDDQREFEVPA